MVEPSVSLCIYKHSLMHQLWPVLWSECSQPFTPDDMQRTMHPQRLTSKGAQQLYTYKACTMQYGSCHKGRSSEVANPFHLTGTSNESWLPLTSSMASSGRPLAFMKASTMPLYICRCANVMHLFVSVASWYTGDQAMLPMKAGSQALVRQCALLVSCHCTVFMFGVHNSMTDTKSACGLTAGMLYLPFLPILVSLHVKCLGIYEVSSQNDCSRFHILQDLLGKQAAEQKVA